MRETIEVEYCPERDETRTLLGARQGVECSTREAKREWKGKRDRNNERPGIVGKTRRSNRDGRRARKKSVT